MRHLTFHDNQETHQQPCRVLMVEDSEDDRILATKNLRESGDVGEVMCFSNGQALIDCMKQQASSESPTLSTAPTVIVVDLNMPGMDGFELLRQLRTEALLQDVPVIVVSGAATFENVSRAFELKAAAFFRKPLSACDLHVFLRHGWPWPLERDR